MQIPTALLATVCISKCGEKKNYLKRALMIHNNFSD